MPSSAAINRVLPWETAVRVRLHREVNMKREKWIRRWDCWMAPKPSRPGVWRRKEGGYLIRGRAKDSRTGRMREVKMRLDDVDAVGAYQFLQQELKRIREGRVTLAPTPISFGEYSVSLLERKVKGGEIKSRKAREHWAGTLTDHLIPFFGGLLMDQLRRADVLAWKDEKAVLITAGSYSPTTANGWLSILRVIVNSYVFEHELERNPIAGVKDFDTSLHATYTEEEPNSLLPEEVPVFLGKMLELYPQHFAMVALGFGTGLRPSSLRPLRRHGPTPDVLWNEGVLLVRRSHTRKQEVMETTKTGQHQRLKLPEELMDILRWHVAELTPKRSETDLLFPPRWGDGFMSSAALDKPFKEVTEALKKEGKLKKKITPRAMRRTFQDLARQAQVKDIVTRAISGHATEQMQQHYSTVNQKEVEESIGKVILLSRARELLELRKSTEGTGGAESGAEALRSACGRRQMPEVGHAN
jgi:integrase